MKKRWWTSENHIITCNCLVETKESIAKVFDPFEVMAVAEHEKIVAALKEQRNTLLHAMRFGGFGGASAVTKEIETMDAKIEAVAKGESSDDETPDTHFV